MLKYNKRDLPNAAPIEHMDFLLNNRAVRVPSFCGVAHKYVGVLETLNEILPWERARAGRLPRPLRC